MARRMIFEDEIDKQNLNNTNLHEELIIKTEVEDNCSQNQNNTILYEELIIKKEYVEDNCSQNLNKLIIKKEVEDNCRQDHTQKKDIRNFTDTNSDTECSTKDSEQFESIIHFSSQLAKTIEIPIEYEGNSQSEGNIGMGKPKGKKRNKTEQETFGIDINEDDDSKDDEFSDKNKIFRKHKLKKTEQRYNMPRKNTVLNGQARKLIYHVNCFMKKEAEEGVGNLKQVQKRTAEATNTSVATVRRIVKESCGDEFLSVFRTPGKKRPRAKPITGVYNFDQGVIKRCIHNFHITEKELPTVEKLRRKLQQDIHFQGSERSLRRIIKSLGFKWKNTENNRQVLIETSNIRLKRIEYLKQMTQYRHEGRPIVYTDESYVDSSHSTLKAWSDESTKGIKNPISKGQRVVIVHAGSETGFIPNALLTFKAGIKTGDYHDNMNFDNYEKWLRTQLIPNLPSNSVVVVNNASYHNKQYDPAPTSNAKKSDLQAWLTEKGIEYSEDMLKPQLYNLVKSNKNKHKKFSIDRILAEYNHDAIRLPPYHPDLNPIEMAWAAIKGYVSRKNVTWSVKGVTELIKEKVELMGASEWTKLCEKVKNIEEEYKRSDHVVDTLTEELIIRANADSDSDSDFTDSDDEYDDEEDDDEMPTARTSFKVESDLMEGVASILP